MNLFPIFVGVAGRHDRYECGYIDAVGNIVIPVEFRGASKFRGGFASVQVGAKWGVIDESGTFAIRPFSERPVLFSESKGVFAENGRCGVVDSAGNVILSPRYFIIDDYSEGLAWMADFGAWTGEPGSHGFLDEFGSVRIPCFYDDARGFREGCAAAKLNGRWGFICRDGSFAIPPVFDMVGSFHAGGARVKIDDKWGYIDHVGKFEIPPRFNVALDFRDGLAPVKEEGYWGYINRSGQYKIRASYDRVGGFCEQLARVELNGLVGYIDKTGELQIEMRFLRGSHFEGGLAFVETSETMGYIDVRGAWVWNTPHVDIGSALTP